MPGTALWLSLGLVAQNFTPFELTPSVAVGLGYGTNYAEASCLVSGQDCATATAAGPLLGLSLELLYGNFISVGARSDLAWIPGRSTAVRGLWLGVLHVGSRFFGEAGVGAGYAWFQRDAIVGSGRVSGTTVDSAYLLVLGFHVVDHLAITAEGTMLPGLPGMMSLGGAIRWSPL
ncbi:MAG: hypothetical protein U1E65_19805 [Myxococcota bacterium]